MVELAGLEADEADHDEIKLSPKVPSKKKLKKARKRRLVKRNYFLTIIAAWIITVPCAAVLGAMFFFMLRGMMMP